VAVEKPLAIPIEEGGSETLLRNTGIIDMVRKETAEVHSLKFMKCV
jgi:hypothetical protein